MTEIVGQEPEELDPTALDSPPRLGTFAALALPDFRQLWLGNVLSFLSLQMQNVARGWLALELTRSNAGLGGVFLAFGVPMLVLTPLEAWPPTDSPRDGSSSALAAWERRSLAISSNLHPSGFDELMPKSISNATVDRLLHHAHVVLTAADSIRPTQATRGKGVKPLAS